MKVGEMRVRFAYNKYVEQCRELGIDTSGWSLVLGRMAVRTEDREPWRIDGADILPGMKPGGICGDSSEEVAARLLVSFATIRDVVRWQSNR
jgi:hypothetical protein